MPLAGLNSCVLGTVLVERTQSFTLEQSMGFGLGSGLGYLLAVLLVTEARHRLRSKGHPGHSAACPSRWCISACWHWQSMVYRTFCDPVNWQEEEDRQWQKYKRQKVKHYHRSFYSRETRVKRGIGIVVLVAGSAGSSLVCSAPRAGLGYAYLVYCGEEP